MLVKCYDGKAGYCTDGIHDAMRIIAAAIANFCSGMGNFFILDVYACYEVSIGNVSVLVSVPLVSPWACPWTIAIG